MATDCNLVNVGTVVFVVVTGGPVLEGIERDSVNHIPCTVCGNNVKKRFEADRLSNCGTQTGVVVYEQNRTTWTTGAMGMGANCVP